ACWTFVIEQKRSTFLRLNLLCAAHLAVKNIFPHQKSIILCVRAIPSHFIHGNYRSLLPDKMAKDLFRVHLIELVEMEPSIWDLSSDEYRLNDRKKNAWARVLKAMNEQGHACGLSELRTIWKNLRDMWKRKKTSTTGSEAAKAWIYGDMLSFLEKAEFHGTTVSNIDANGNFISVPEEFGSSPSPPCSSPKRLSLDFESPTMRKRPRSRDDPLQMIKTATEAVKNNSELKNFSTEEKGRKELEDRYSAFGYWIGMMLRGMHEDVAEAKMHLLSTALLTDASVIVNECMIIYSS
ncbi:hypothetical protein GCK32_015025, partial [Trichostrongylus colubriformis]